MTTRLLNWPHVAFWLAVGLIFFVIRPAQAIDDAKHPVPREHPRLLGSRDHLQQLAKDRAEAYRRTARIAREQGGDDYSKMISMSLVCAVEQDATLGKNAVDMAMKYIRGPIRIGHVPFAQDLALCGIVYDLCHEHWTAEQRAEFHRYLNKTVDENRQSETHVFHNGWYGYKHWGIGVACYASYYENDRSAAILKELEDDWHARAAPALNLADYFLHVLTAATAASVAAATLETGDDQVTVVAGSTRVTFRTAEVGGDILINGSRRAITNKVSSAP